MRKERVAWILLLGALIAVLAVWLAGRGGGGSGAPSAGPDQTVAPTAPSAPGNGGAPLAGESGPVIAVTHRRAQRIEGWGTSVLGTGGADPIVSGKGLSASQLRVLDRLIFRKAGINLVRVLPEENLLRPVPNRAAWSSSDQRLRFMRRVRPLGVRFMFTGAGAPLRMRVGNSPIGALAPGQERAYAQFLVRSLAVAQRSGAPFKWTAIGNEVDNPGYHWVSMQPAQAALVYQDLARDIRARGLATRLVLGDTETWGGTNRYSNAAWSSRAVRRLASVVASHGYGVVEPAVVQPVKEFAKRRRLSLWMTEWVSGCTADPYNKATQLALALQWATRITSDLTLGDVQAWFMLQAVPPAVHGASCGIAVSRFGNRRHPYVLNKRYWMLRQFTSVARPGAHRYETASDAGGLPAIAFRRAGTTGLVVTNPRPVAARVRILLGHRGVLSARRTSATENFARVLRRRRYGGGQLSQVLPARSITTFKLVSR
jgi:O-glycosyl hydrolase